MIWLADGYALYVLVAYGASAAILGWLVWSTLRANARARAELSRIEGDTRP